MELFLKNSLILFLIEYDILKIICLYSIINSGYKNKIYDQLRKEFFLVYGFQELFLWRNLEKLGILKAADNKSIYQTILKKLNLINEEQFESKEQKDISYIYKIKRTKRYIIYI